MFRKLRQLLTPVSSSTPSPDPDLSGAQRRSAASEPSDSDLLARWSTGQLDGRRVDVFRPASEQPSSSAVLFLHGHGQVRLTNNLVFSRLFDRYGLTVVCPDGGQSWWLDVVCSEFDAQVTPQQWLLQSVVPMIEHNFGIVPPQIALLGVSMGGQGVLQLAYRYASRFPTVVAISPAVDFYQLYGSGIPLDAMFPDAEAARQASVVLNLHPLAWPRHQFFCCDPADVDWFDGCARLGMKLSSSGILHERDLETSHGGHSWEYFNHMAERAVQHLVRSLSQQASAT